MAWINFVKEYDECKKVAEINVPFMNQFFCRFIDIQLIISEKREHHQYYFEGLNNFDMNYFNFYGKFINFQASNQEH